MSKTIRLTDLQNLFYVWMSKFEKRSLENIKVHCDFLNESYGLNLPYPNWSIFWPLVFNGLIDHIGKGYYALTAPVINKLQAEQRQIQATNHRYLFV